MSAARAGFVLGWSRLLGRALRPAAALAAALVLVAAVVERRFGSAGAVDRVLAATFNVVVPLLVFAIAGAAAARGKLADAVWPVARFGASRRGVALGLVLAAVTCAAVAGSVCALVGVVAAHGPGNPPLARDAFTSGGIGALVGGAYAGWFALGSTFGRRGGGRLLVLVADAVLASSTGVLGAVFPRAYAESLLGGDAVLQLSRPGASGVLVATGLAAALAAVYRAGP